jgi:Flp pilus assembly protein TadD
LPAREDLKLRLATRTRAASTTVSPGPARSQLLDRRFPRGHYVLGDLQLRRGQVPDAIESFRTVVRLDPGMGVAHFALGSAYERARGVGQGRGGVQARPGPSPEGSEGVQQSGLDLCRAGQEPRGRPHARTKGARAGGELPKSARDGSGILDTLGFVHYSRGEYTQAEPILKKASELAANDATIQSHLGLTYYRLGQKDQAATWLRRLLQSGGNVAEANRIRDLLKELCG